MLINLSNNNCHYRCVHKHWKSYLNNKFKKYYDAKEVSSGIVDIGQYKFAKHIGFCFDKCKCTKIVIHNIYKNEPYYSKSMLTNYSQLQELRKNNPKLFDDSRWVLKKSNSFSGLGVIPFSSWDDILRKNITGNNTFVLQKEIIPSLYNGFKFDVRSYILIIKEHNNYQAYFMDYGIVRINKIEFDKNNNKSFTTNLFGGRSEPEFYEEFFKKYRPNNYNKIINKFLDISKKASQKFVKYISEKNREYFIEKNEPPYQLMVMGYDIMFDENDNAKLLEINNYPGFLMKHIRYEKRKRELLMVEKIWDNVIVPWVSNKKHTMNNNKYFIKFV